MTDSWGLFRSMAALSEMYNGVPSDYLTQALGWGWEGCGRRHVGGKPSPASTTSLAASRGDLADVMLAEAAKVAVHTVADKRATHVADKRATFGRS